MNIAIVLSGGIGSRVGQDIPKQYIEVCHQMMITYCLRTLCEHPMIDAVQVVAEKDWKESIISDLEKHSVDTRKIKGCSVPGENRQLSIINGMKDVRRYADEHAVILIHDAARPLLKAKQITECFDALQQHDGVLPVLPMKDTIYFSENGLKISRLMKRQKLYAGQAPEVFRLNRYYESNMSLSQEEIMHVNGSTEPAIMNGLDIVMIPGDESNIKITTKQDLEQFIESTAYREGNA